MRQTPSFSSSPSGWWTGVCCAICVIKFFGFHLDRRTVGSRSSVVATPGDDLTYLSHSLLKKLNCSWLNPSLTEGLGILGSLLLPPAPPPQAAAPPSCWTWAIVSCLSSYFKAFSSERARVFDLAPPAPLSHSGMLWLSKNRMAKWSSSDIYMSEYTTACFTW